jgi:phosphopantothenoylcysteine decarboxylase/phosphopantothenate--cysteine ligase
MLASKRILLGITGGIAAYKTTFLTRLLIKAGAEVRIVMTPASVDFVSPLTLAALSKNEVLSSFVREEDGSVNWNNHVDLGLWADVILIAPATANTLSKMASGTCDNLLMACYLSAKCPVFIAPAMDLDMYKHPATKKSLQTLEGFGNIVIPVEAGELASGLVGEGRMAEPETIITHLRETLGAQQPFSGKRIMITAGPTYEAIDPVRYVGNHSSGKMGYALAEAAASMGAEVTLISGPTALHVSDPAIHLIRVTSAEEMYAQTLEYFEKMDIVIGAAAVADYRPENPATEKLKKTEDSLQINLVRNPDIIAALGKKKTGQYLVGFALETENELEYAQGKLREKNLDAIVLNSLRDPGAGFGTDTNKVTLIDKNSAITPFELKTKSEVARDLLHEIYKRLSK